MLRCTPVPMQRRQDDDVHVEQLHEHDPARDAAELMRLFLDRTQEQDRERNEEPADDEQRAQEPFHDSVFRRMKYCVSSGMFAYQ